MNLHRHQWAPWYNVWFGPDYVPSEKEFSNGRGCLICHRREHSLNLLDKLASALVFGVLSLLVWPVRLWQRYRS